MQANGAWDKALNKPEKLGILSNAETKLNVVNGHGRPDGNNAS